MPNWCYNYLHLDNPESKNGLRMIAAFEQMNELEKASNQGQQVPGIDMNDYFFSIGDECTEQISFETKWGLDIGDMKKVAEHFQADFECDYEEHGSSVYGRIIYKDGVFTDYSLDEEDTAAIQFDDDDDFIPIKLGSYIVDCESEALEYLLEQKIAACQSS